jgi:hypothetical protein
MKLSILLSMLLVLSACDVVRKPPSEALVKASLQQQLPEHIEITSLTLELVDEANESFRQKLIAEVKVREDLYLQSDTIADVAVLSQSEPSGHSFQLEGVALSAVSTVKAESEHWNTTFENIVWDTAVEGMTRDKFPDSAVVFGSDAEVKARQLFEQEIESQRLNAENAAKLLNQANQRESLRLAEQDLEDRAAAEKAARLKARKDRLRAVSSGNF